MLLREPDGNAAQLFNNGNVSLQQESQQTWTDKTISPNSNTIEENSEIETETGIFERLKFVFDFHVYEKLTVLYIIT